MVAVDNNGDGGRQQRGTMKAADDDGTRDQVADLRGKEESWRQTTTALGQPGRECETKIKKSSLRKKTFFSDMVCLVGVFAPAKNQLSSFSIFQSYLRDYPVLRKQEICSAWQTWSTEHSGDTIFGLLLSYFLLCLQNYVIRN
jgi:hypothetical protein